MNWFIIYIEVIMILLLFSAMTLILMIINPLSYIHDYPFEIQEEYFKTHKRMETAPLSRRVILMKSIAILVFSLVFVLGALWAKADSFLDVFFFFIVVFAAIGAYDTFFQDLCMLLS